MNKEPLNGSSLETIDRRKIQSRHCRLYRLSPVSLGNPSTKSARRDRTRLALSNAIALTEICWNLRIAARASVTDIR